MFAFGNTVERVNASSDKLPYLKISRTAVLNGNVRFQKC